MTEIWKIYLSIKADDADEAFEILRIASNHLVDEGIEVGTPLGAVLLTPEAPDTAVAPTTGFGI